MPLETKSVGICSPICSILFSTWHNMLILGAIPETVYIHVEEVSDVTYVSDRARVKVKAIGTLTRWDVQSLHKTEQVTRTDRVAADSGDTDEPSVDLSKVGVIVCAVVMAEIGRDVHNKV